MSADATAIRSLLFAPATDERKVAKLPSCGADAIVLDLEDAVAQSQKARARTLAREALPRLVHEGLTAVRINALSTGLAEDDLDAVVRVGLDAVVVPKVDAPADVEWVERRITTAERRHGLPPRSVRLLPLIETARGVAASEAIAQAGAPRLVTLVLGTEDLASDLRLASGADAAALAYARGRVVVAARAAELSAPLDGPVLRFQDAELLAADSRRSRALGFGGRVVVHPAQVPVVHEAYGGSAGLDAERLGEIVRAFERAERAGSAAIDVDGLFVDYPIYERAKRELRTRAMTTGAAR